ncbi:MAG TPA: c-type cytochrome [Methylomirabilota bacterium]|nr:c-type cytochrome [Methylomirabilota bacterium]
MALLALASTAGAQGKPRSGGKAASAPNPYAQRFATLCAACHGANGRSDMPGTPALAGQHSFYAITQLFLFREGRRSNEAMTAVAKQMSDADLRGFADFIATLPPVAAPPPATPSDAARMKKGADLARQHKCLFCHGADFAGGQQVPRIAGQREDYLQMTLRGFKSGQRPGYTMAMGEAVSQVTAEELDTLAYYAARFPVAAAAPGK